jgi:DNA-binding NtrC family response regulator
VKEFDGGAVAALQARAWTGNIRELRNVVERLIILGGEVISADDVNMFG